MKPKEGHYLRIVNERSALSGIWRQKTSRGILETLDNCLEPVSMNRYVSSPLESTYRLARAIVSHDESQRSVEVNNFGWEFSEVANAALQIKYEESSKKLT